MIIPPIHHILFLKRFANNKARNELGMKKDGRGLPVLLWQWKRDLVLVEWYSEEDKK